MLRTKQFTMYNNQYKFVSMTNAWWLINQVGKQHKTIRSFPYLPMICGSKGTFLMLPTVAQSLSIDIIILAYIWTALQIHPTRKNSSVITQCSHYFFFHWQEEEVLSNLINALSVSSFLHGIILWHKSTMESGNSCSCLAARQPLPCLNRGDDRLGTFIYNEHNLVVSSVERICFRNKALANVMSVNPFQQTKLSFNADFETYKRIPNLK